MRLSLVVCLLLAALAACTSPPADYRQQFFAMGTLVEVETWGVPRDQAVAAVDAVRQRLTAFDHKWNPWGDGELARVNAALAKGRSMRLSAAMARGVRQAMGLAEASGERFDPAIGDLIRLWGFDADERPDGPPPAQDAIARLVATRPRMSDLHLAGRQLSADKTDIVLDFGGFAKGLAVDRAIEVLRSHGVNNAIVNAGGDLRAIGRHGDRPWRIGIRNPRGPGIMASLEVSGDQSVFTSGDYERYFTWKGRRYHHILNPRTGYPSEGVTSATVVHANAATADAAATALMVAGPDDWVAVARAMHLKQVMLVDSDGTVQLSPAMAACIEFPGDQPPVTRQGPPL
ncbi:MAG: FAD:protein FMN transferase [Gammaproteobacteria bacterium]|jgi:thiamine biosynthesis lipoprotein